MSTMALSKKELNPNIYLSEGNLKLMGDSNNQFLIWNIPAVVTCLWKTPMCEKLCYARKAEVLYTGVLPCRTRNLEESEKNTFVHDMADILRWNFSRKKFEGKQIWFRIHESGDFYSLEYLEKWIKIAKKFPGVKFLAYTKAVRLVEMAKDDIPSNLVIRYSVWEDTKPEEMEIATKLELPIYTAFNKKILDEKVKSEGFTKCDCDCKVCKKCYTGKITKLAVAIH